jgi:PAS domain S-box-containing protein
VRDEAGRIQHAFHLATDITERKRIEQELALLKDRAHSYLQIAAVMIVAIDASQRVTVVNQKACEILGYPKSSILGRNWFDAFIPEGERSRVKGAFAALLRGEIELAQYHENPVLTRGGAERIIAWHNTTLHDAAGAISGTLSSGTDITDRRRADEDLRALNETLEHRVAERTALAETQARQLRMLARELTQAEMHERERVARVLHDNFQQLLVAARLHVEMLLRGDAGPRQRHQLDKVNDILQESIRECNSLAVELCPPVLYDLGLAAGLEWLGERMRALHGLRVRVETCPDAEPEDVDLRAFLFEAVRELLFNVVKHARADAAIVTMDRTPSGLVKIAVADRGRGFDSSESSPDQSLEPCLGLFSIRGRLMSLGGRLEVESAAGRGTRVALYAPLRG